MNLQFGQAQPARLISAPQCCGLRRGTHPKVLNVYLAVEAAPPLGLSGGCQLAHLAQPLCVARFQD